VGMTPLIKIPARRKSLSILSSIANHGKVGFMILKRALKTTARITFMRRLSRDAEKKVFLILDNLNVRKAAPVRKWIERHSDSIAAFFLSPYSSALTLDEHLNSDFKRALYTDISAPDQARLHRQPLGHFRRIQKIPARVAVYFKQPAIRYAA